MNLSIALSDRQEAILFGSKAPYMLRERDAEITELRKKARALIALTGEPIRITTPDGQTTLWEIQP